MNCTHSTNEPFLMVTCQKLLVLLIKYRLSLDIMQPFLQNSTKLERFNFSLEKNRLKFYNTFGNLTQELQLGKAFESHVNRIETFQLCTKKAIFENVCENASFYFPLSVCKEILFEYQLFIPRP